MSAVQLNKGNKTIVIACTRCRQNHKYMVIFTLFFRTGGQGGIYLL